MGRGGWVSGLYTVGLWVKYLGRCLPDSCIFESRAPPLFSCACSTLPTGHRTILQGLGASPAPSSPPHSLMHLFMSGLRASKYPGGQDGRQTPTWRMSLLSSRMKSLGEHLRQPLTSEQSSQPLAQAWLPSALTAGWREDDKTAVEEPTPYCQAPTRMGYRPLGASLHKRSVHLEGGARQTAVCEDALGTSPGAPN